GYRVGPTSRTYFDFPSSFLGSSFLGSSFLGSSFFVSDFVSSFFTSGAVGGGVGVLGGPGVAVGGGMGGEDSGADSSVLHPANRASESARLAIAVAVFVGSFTEFLLSCQWCVARPNRQEPQRSSVGPRDACVNTTLDGSPHHQLARYYIRPLN